MNGNPISLRASPYWFLPAALVLQAGFLYLWLFHDAPLTIRVWGFTILPTWISPVAILPFVVRIHWKSTEALKVLAGSVSRWFLAIFIPVFAFGLLTLWYISLGGKFDIPWKWITLALSAVFDFPLIAFWTLPMTVVQVIAWQASLQAKWRRDNRFVALVSGVLFCCANAPLVIFTAGEQALIDGVSMACVLISLGMVVFRLQANGNLLPASVFLSLSGTLLALFAGSELSEVNHILFGYDVDNVTALLQKKIITHEMVYFFLATAFGVFSIIVPSGRKTHT